ncbi:hypothetical protein M0N77_13090 [Psychrobacter sp. AH5]|uniref:hypothetical protein n=1 Tax=Psychrobacter sp. AH5 TaxID=2937433 RepID=UPI0033415AF1
MPKTSNSQVGQTYFIYVDMDEQGNSSLMQITENNALQMLAISAIRHIRLAAVVPNCPPPVVVSAPVCRHTTSSR